MKYIKTFEQLSNQLKKSKLDLMTSKWCDGLISESEFLIYLDGQVNEAIFDWLSGIKEKIVDMFYTFVIKSYEIGLAIYEKVSTFIKWISSKISNWREKHPTAWKIIIVTLVIIIIFIVTASSAKAATTGAPIPSGKIDMAIGWLDSLKSHSDQDPMIVNKAIAHLVDLRDGQVDITGLGSEAIKMADAALLTCDKIMVDAKSQTDPKFFKFCISLIESGRSYVDAIFTKGDGFENIKLVTR